MAKSNLTSIVLAIVMFLALAGFIYWVLPFTGYIFSEWARITLSLIISFVFGLLFYLRGKTLKAKNN